MNSLLLQSDVTSGTQFPEWLSKNAWWLALIVVGAIVLTVGCIFLFGSKKKKAKTKVAERSVYLEALGGSENIVRQAKERSRIVVELHDSSKVDQAKLKEAGVDGFILMSHKLTLVIKGDADAVYKAIFGE